MASFKERSVIIGEINSAVSLAERLGRWWKSRKRADTVASRFVSLFNAHGVHRNQIFRLLGRPLPIVNLQTDEAMLGSLTTELLDQAASLFAIRRDWLDCATDEIYPLHDFYKKPEQFGLFLDGLISRRVGDISGFILVGESNRHEETGIIVIEESVGFLDQKPLYRYHLCNNWFFSYWKSRAYLTACVATAWNREIYLLGRRVPIELVRKYSSGTSFLERRTDSALPHTGQLWYPEDMVVKPDSFLDGISEGDFGRRHAIDLWLQLDELGFMEVDLPYEGVRSAFSSRLAR
jgi:hypothetical protein